ncbi:hypothetical protein H4R33_004635 [Dimargaris cristalligena]|nr:hypothetical protein H4R33_004635 [Dimargaris cristalligena]
MEFRKSESKPAEVIKYTRAKGVPRSKVIKPKTSSESTTGPKNSSSKSKKTGCYAAIALGAKFKVGGIPSQKLRKELNAKNETKMQEAVTKARDEGYYSNTVKRNLERQFNLKKKDKKDDRGLDTTSAIGRERDGVLRIRHSLLKD